MRASVESIKARGKAAVGDKTMVDALEPAVIAMEKSNKEDLVNCIEKGAEAAKAGVEATKNMVAKFGRAKSLMERAIGFQDAGATSVQIIFETMHVYLKSKA
jgi:dihydroxyacetone kinase